MKSKGRLKGSATEPFKGWAIYRKLSKAHIPTLKLNTVKRSTEAKAQSHEATEARVRDNLRTIVTYMATNNKRLNYITKHFKPFV